MIQIYSSVNIHIVAALNLNYHRLSSKMAFEILDYVFPFFENEEQKRCRVKKVGSLELCLLSLCQKPPSFSSPSTPLP